MDLKEIGTKELVRELVDRADAIVLAARGLPLDGEMSRCIVIQSKGSIDSRLGLCRGLTLDIESRWQLPSNGDFLDELPGGVDE